MISLDLIIWTGFFLWYLSLFTALPFMFWKLLMVDLRFELRNLIGVIDWLDAWFLNLSGKLYGWSNEICCTLCIKGCFEVAFSRRFVMLNWSYPPLMLFLNDFKSSFIESREELEVYIIFCNFIGLLKLFLTFLLELLSILESTSWCSCYSSWN